MAATHEVAPDALPFSDQEYEQLSKVILRLLCVNSATYIQKINLSVWKLGGTYLPSQDSS